ncbi:MAG: 50S ribosomal protein L3 [Candidatus Omnitrophica bacterium]|nr:50S ribosomal protein L3 [Candidatus Omnitrophota bacterium]
MIRGLIGKKLGMTQIFDKDGNVVPVTVVEAGPCPVLGLREEPLKIKVGFDPVKESRVKKPQLGFFKKVGVAPMRLIKEFESTDNKDYQVGQEVKADIFKAGDFVDISGVSKGKGFQGGMKRWNWSGGPAGHGSMHHRRVGSIGASADPSRTFRGTHMPGQMGAQNVTTQGLRVIEVDVENNILLIKGAVPGSKNSLVVVNRSKKKVYRSLDEKSATMAKKRNPMKQSKAKAKGKK